MSKYTKDEILAMLDEISIDEHDQASIDDDEQQAYVDGYQDAIDQIKQRLNN